MVILREFPGGKFQGCIIIRKGKVLSGRVQHQPTTFKRCRTENGFGADFSDVNSQW